MLTPREFRAGAAGGPATPAPGAHHATWGRGGHSPLPTEGASPFTNGGKGLPGAGTSREAPAPPPSRSIFPVCCRSRCRSCDSRLNCSLCVRHFSSSSRTLLCTAQARTRGQGRAGGVHACTRVCGAGRPPTSTGEQRLIRPGVPPPRPDVGNRARREALPARRSQPTADRLGWHASPQPLGIRSVRR